MAQARVTEFYATKKRKPDTQPSKRRKLQPSSDVADSIQGIRKTRSAESSETRKGLNSEFKNDLFTFSKSGTGLNTKDSKLRTRKIKQIKGQQTISKVLSTQLASPLIESSTIEEITSAWDEHDGPLTPSKKTKQNNDTDDNKLSRKRNRLGEFKDGEKTPQKSENNEKVQAPRSRKKLQLCANVSASDKQDDVDIPTTPLAISPLPDTPEVVRQQMKKGPDVPTSSKVQSAMEKLKELNKDGCTLEKISEVDAKERQKKCEKFEDLKAQLSQFNESKKVVKKIEPKRKTKVEIPDSKQEALGLEKFEAIEVKVEVPEKSGTVSDQKLPAFERFHHLRTPAPPSLTLPYKYKLVENMFRAMETAVSMLHNRSEICTFSKLKSAVQKITRRNFEQKNVGQIKTVYPEAYTFRQEKGLPAFGQKSHDYQLTVEPNLGDEDPLKTKAERRIFSAKEHLQRCNTFHNRLISLVVKHHKDFLSSLSRPLSVPEDKITRWHPRFSLDEVPDIPAACLPEAPFVKKYQTARDVLEDNKAKLTDRLKKALESVAMENTTKKPSSQEESPSSKTSSPSSKTSSQLLGVPQSLLEKIRAKEAQKQVLAMMRDPVADKRSLMISRLPEMMRIIRTHFLTEKKPSLPLENVVCKVTDSYKTSIRSDVVESHVKLLIELVPEWLTVVEIKKGKYLKMDRNIDMGMLQAKVSNMAKS